MLMKKSNRKHKKYMINYNGKWIHFGDNRYSDFTKHKDEERRIRYLKRHWNVFNKDGERAIMNPESPSYYSARVLWGFNPKKDISKIQS